VNEFDYLLTLLIEECAEVQQRATKALRFGLGEIQPGQPLDNEARLAAEVVDLLTILRMLRDRGVLVDVEPSADKAEKVRLFMAYSRDLGRITGSHS
jgi:hypothetical protein